MAAKRPAKPPGSSMDGVIYARFSSHSQKEESIEQQVEECTAFALANNINIIEVYADKAISGRTDQRSSFQRMMRDAEKRKFQVVIAYKSNRIARNMLNALSYENKLEAYRSLKFFIGIGILNIKSTGGGRPPLIDFIVLIKNVVAFSLTKTLGKI